MEIKIALNGMELQKLIDNGIFFKVLEANTFGGQTQDGNLGSARQLTVTITMAEYRALLKNTIENDMGQVVYPEISRLKNELKSAEDDNYWYKEYQKLKKEVDENDKQQG